MICACPQTQIKMAAPVRSSEAITASACDTDTYSRVPHVTQCSSISTTSSELRRLSMLVEVRFLFVAMQTINSFLHQEDLGQRSPGQGATTCGPCGSTPSIHRVGLLEPFAFVAPP